MNPIVECFIQMEPFQKARSVIHAQNPWRTLFWEYSVCIHLHMMYCFMQKTLLTFFSNLESEKGVFCYSFIWLGHWRENNLQFEGVDVVRTGGEVSVHTGPAAKWSIVTAVHTVPLTEATVQTLPVPTCVQTTVDNPVFKMLK